MIKDTVLLQGYSLHYQYMPFVKETENRVDTKFRNKKLVSYFAKWSYYFAKRCQFGALDPGHASNQIGQD
jgi:hypothetical protein